MTCFVQAMPGEAGPVAYVDDDGTIDVNMTDCEGQPWFCFRAREGTATFAAGSKPDSGRGIGVAEALTLPVGPYLESSPFAATALEVDMLLGRRGVLGWNGEAKVRNLKLEGAREWSWWKAVAGAVLGAAIVGAMVGVVILCPWLAVPLLALLAVGYGVSFAQRYEQTGSFWTAAYRAGQDVTGVSSLYAGLTGKDIATNEDLGYNSFERGFAFGTGFAAILGLAVAAARPFVRAGWARFQAWRAGPQPMGPGHNALNYELLKTRLILEQMNLRFTVKPMAQRAALAHTLSSTEAEA